jgi:hypothetical protein
MFTTRWWNEKVGQSGGTGGVDDAFLERHDRGSAQRSWVPGSGAFPGWHEDPDWKGAWGPNPPFHTPVFVLTHHTRRSIEMEGGTTYHFLDVPAARR